jgi:pyruvate/2-oxoglutarate dehydrogenase complex dihydrolipoamide acyltransferase (E2) component
MPQMGESVSEGTVLEWLKQVGDQVEADEPLVAVTTDKVDAEVPAPASGTLTRILADPDATVQVGGALGEIEVGGDGPAATTGDDDGAAGAGDDDGAAGAGDDDGPAGAGDDDGPAGAGDDDGAAGAGDEGPPAEAEVETVDVTFPEMGDSVAEGTVLEWRVERGDTVAADEVLVEISTDKVDAEVPAPVAGTVAEILVEVDETVQVGSVLCRIAAGAGAPAGPVEPAAGEGAPAGPVEPAAAPAEAAVVPAGPSDGNGANATPVAARMANAHGLDLGAVKGTGPRGRVTKDDVLAAIEGNGGPGGPAPATAVPPPRSSSS